MYLEGAVDVDLKDKHDREKETDDIQYLNLRPFEAG
jgi:hypothetical protein